MASGPLIKIKLLNLKEINQRLGGLVDKLQKRLLVRVLTRTLESVKKDAEARAPRGTKSRVYRGKTHPGYLKSSFRIQNMNSKDPFLTEVQMQSKAYTALWVEYGHRLVRGRGKNARVVGSVPAKPFMRPAFDSNVQRMISDVQKLIDSELTRKGL